MKMAEVRGSPPTRFWIVSALLLLWALAGLGAFYAHVTLSPQTLATMSDHDRRMFLSLPVWFGWVYAIATVPAAAGAITLLLRSSVAIWLYALSLAGIVVQFGWVFGATDLIAVKGAAATLPFPLTILALGLFSLWFARLAARRGWIV
jgi:hypothetical protein